MSRTDKALVPYVTLHTTNARKQVGITPNQIVFLNTPMGYSTYTQYQDWHNYLSCKKPLRRVRDKAWKKQVVKKQAWGSIS